MSDAMVDKYGRGKVRQVVADFYGRVLDSPALAPYFDDVDIHTLVSHQSAFLAAVMGGPKSHDSEQIRRSHAQLEITESDFAEMIELLGRSLDRFGFEPDDRRTVQDRYRGYADQVVAVGG